MSYNQKKFLDYDGLIHLLKKFDDYPTNDILGTVIDSIGTAIDAKVSDVQINGTSIVSNGTANIPIAGASYGVVKALSLLGIGTNASGALSISTSNDSEIKAGTNVYKPITPSNQQKSTFYGLATAAGDTTQSQSNNAVGTYTDDAKAAIQTMLDVPSNAIVTSAIGTAIGNIHQFSIEVVQALPTENIQEHTVYFVPKTGETNDVYDEYVYVNNGWEMIGNTQIDLSNYVQKTDYASNTTAGVVKTSRSIGILSTGEIGVVPAGNSEIKEGLNHERAITPGRQHIATFFGLAKAAGDVTQAASDNGVGTYTNDAKTAIRNMLGVSSALDVSAKADKTDTVLETTLSRGRKENTTIGIASFAFGLNVEASGMYSRATGVATTASGRYSIAEGYGSTATGQSAHAEGNRTNASGINSHSEGTSTTASAEASHSEGTQTTAGGTGSHAEGYGTLANACLLHTEGRYNQSATIYPEWTTNIAYVVGDKVSYNNIGFICIVDNSDAEWNNAHWQIIYHNSEKALIIGNGTSDNARSNAYALDWTGNGYYMGNVYVGANADSTGGARLATVTELATKLNAAEAGLKVVRLI